MYRGKSFFFIYDILLFTFILIISVYLTIPNATRAQHWAAIPPYNVLWPLFSPVLSPTDPITGLPTPLVTSLTNNTILPVQPALVFDPCQPNVAGMGFLVYNTPPAFGTGLTYWDPYYGLNPWPPSYMQDPITGAPLPIALPIGWSFLVPGSLIELKHFEWFVPLGNAAFSLEFGIPFSSLLTPADIWGNLILPVAALPTPII
jgi:hypothetical protein